MKLEKKKYFLCPMCGEKLKLPKTEELEIIFIKCSCGCGSFIQVRNGYHIPFFSNSQIHYTVKFIPFTCFYCKIFPFFIFFLVLTPNK